ncbi:MAG: CopG family transcriptional regulator [Gammaproteobacteria bacterium]|nr:CopG family transcriptional regulator [Gammaproteobacteria bacterium]NBT45230.1 CopG family transcriptional regulator [Gammaproteobacteria bacterium]
MARQSISFTAPNDRWLNSLVESEEYSSKSEIVNDLIRRARAQQSELELIRSRLIKAENSGFITQSSEELRSEFKDELRRDGTL